MNTIETVFASPYLNAVKDIAVRAHGCQMRRGTMELYSCHPIRVALDVQQMGGGEQAIAAALLHDVLEDTHLTEEMLCKLGVNNTTIWMVKALTRGLGVTHEEYLNRILDIGNLELRKAVMLIKLADVNDNMKLDYRFLWPDWEASVVRYQKIQLQLVRALNSLQKEKQT